MKKHNYYLEPADNKKVKQLAKKLKVTESHIIRTLIQMVDTEAIIQRIKE